MEYTRLLRHLVLPPWWVKRAFPKSLLGTIDRAISASETTHHGELRLVVETNLPIQALWAGQSPRARAIDLFSQLRVWDTENNSGVLIYLQLLDPRDEIVADRGINAKVDQQFWNAVCRHMETAFRAGRFEDGVLEALGTITAELARQFPTNADGNPNELSNAPIVL